MNYPVLVQNVHKNLKSFKRQATRHYLTSNETQCYINDYSIKDDHAFLISVNGSRSSGMVILPNLIKLYKGSTIFSTLSIDCSDKNEFFQLSTVHNYLDMKYEDIVLIKEIFEYCVLNFGSITNA